MAGKQFSFDELDKTMTKIDPLGSMITNNSFSRIDEWISTGNYLLNAQISGSLFKGIPNSRSVMFAGESGVGKSFLALNVCREAQKMGYHIIYGDSEAAVDEDIMIKFGIDPAKVRYQPFKTAMHVRHFVANLVVSLKEKQKAGFELPKILFVMDSLGNLVTEKEINDAVSGSEKRDMTKQQNMRSMFRVITADLAEMKIPTLFTNHTYAAIGSYVPMQIISGGGGAIYNMSIILALSKAGLKEDGVSKTGIVVTSKPAKNRFAKPIPIKFHISFFKGMNPYVGLENYVTWDSVGIGRGELIEEILETPIFEADGVTPKMYRGKPKIERTKTGNITFKADPKATTFAVKHLNKTVKGSEVFKPEVFTEDILQKLDDQIIKKLFELPKVVMDDDELDEALGLENEESGMSEDSAMEAAADETNESTD